MRSNPLTLRRLVLVDSHLHIDMPAFDADRDAVMARARAAGVEAMLLIGGIDEEQGHLRALRVAGELGLPVSAGVHPHEARLATAAVYDELRALAADEADRGHRRDRPRLPLRPLAARRAAGGVPRPGAPGPRGEAAGHHPHPRGRRRDGGAAGGGRRHRGRHPLLHRRPRPGPARPRPRLLHLLLRDHRVPAGARSSRKSRARSPSTACWSRPTARSWPRRRTAASATSPRSWSRSCARSPACAASRRRRSERPRWRTSAAPLPCRDCGRCAVITSARSE